MNLNILVPMAGHGSRFAEAGYTFPKPLIEVGEEAKPMIQVVIENLGFRGHYWFFVQKAHADKYPMRSLLKMVTKNYGECTVVETPEVTGGQAESVLRLLEKVEESGGGDSPVIVANSDQFMDGWHPGAFSDYINRHDPDAAIFTFHGTHPKWSFCKLFKDDGHRVQQVAEKDPISTRANVGVFYVRSANMLVQAITQMMANDEKRVKGEWYLAPSFNEMIYEGKYVMEFPIPRMLGLGTPEDFQRFERLLEAGKVRI